MSESTENPELPEDIEILLECLQARDDLELEEMRPLRDWLADTPGGELAVSNALEQNNDLAVALEAAEINVPKQLQRGLHSYVLRNIRAEADERVAEQARTLPAPINEVPKRRDKVSKLQFSIGFLAGLATLVLAGFFVAHTIDRFSALEEEQVALKAEDWFAKAKEKTDWNRAWSDDIVGFKLPLELAPHPIQSTKLKTPFGQAHVFELKYEPQNPDRRAMLFVFKSKKTLDTETRFLSTSPVRYTSQCCVGVAKNGSTVYALVVDGDLGDYAALIRPDNAMVQTASLMILKFVRLLC